MEESDGNVLNATSVDRALRCKPSSSYLHGLPEICWKPGKFTQLQDHGASGSDFAGTALLSPHFPPEKPGILIRP